MRRTGYGLRRRSRIRYQTIAESEFGHDVLWKMGVLFEFATQAGDVNAHCAPIRHTRTPYLFDELVVPNHTIRVSRKNLENPMLESRQPYCAAVAMPGAPPLQVHANIP